MMNATHGPSGALAGLAILAGRVQLMGAVDPVTAGLWVVGCTAGALLPDADHPSSYTARLWGPLTSVPARALGRWAGGHRAGTHDVSRGAPVLFGLVFAVGLLVPLLARVLDGRWATASTVTGTAVLALLFGMTFLGFAAFLPGRWEAKPLINFVFSWAAALAVGQYYPSGLPLLTVALVGLGVAVGVLTGIAGDACTVSGVPWRGRDVHLLPRAMRIHTGRWTELVFFRLPILTGIVVLLALLGHPAVVA